MDRKQAQQKLEQLISSVRCSALCKNYQLVIGIDHSKLNTKQKSRAYTVLAIQKESGVFCAEQGYSSKRSDQVWKYSGRFSFQPCPWAQQMVLESEIVWCWW